MISVGDKRNGKQVQFRKTMGDLLRTHGGISSGNDGFLCWTMFFWERMFFFSMKVSNWSFFILDILIYFVCRDIYCIYCTLTHKSKRKWGLVTWSIKPPEVLTGKQVWNQEECNLAQASAFLNTPPKANMSPENQWLEDVFPIQLVPF